MINACSNCDCDLFTERGQVIGADGVRTCLRCAVPREDENPTPSPGMVPSQDPPHAAESADPDPEAHPRPGRESAEKNDRALPQGIECYDCHWWPRCRDLFLCEPDNTECNWSPSRYVPREDVAK